MTTSTAILLVEDDPGDVFLFREALRNTSLEYELHVADNGEKALDFMHRRPPFAGARRPDLVVLDLNLPRINGIEVLREIRALPEFGELPVIVLTTSKSDTDARLCRELGANAFLSKPPAFDEFLAVGQTIERFCHERIRNLE